MRGTPLWLGGALLSGLVAAAPGRDARPASTPAHFLCSLVGDELRLRIDKPHGRELAIAAPNGVLYLVAFEPKPGLPDAPHKPFDRFAGAHELSVDARSLEGWRTQAGRQRWEPIFTARGTYQFRVADDVMAAAAADTSFCSLTRK